MPEPATPVTTTSTPSGMSTSTLRRLCVGRSADLEHPAGVRSASLRRRPVVEMATGERAAPAQPLDGALEADAAPGRAGAGSEVDDVIGDLDRLRLVLDDEDGIALVPSRSNRSFICWTSCGCRPAVGSSKT